MNTHLNKGLTAKIKEMNTDIKILKLIQEKLRKSRENFFKIEQKKNEEETDSNIRSSGEKAN